MSKSKNTPRYRVFIDRENDAIAFWHSVSIYADTNASEYHSICVKLANMAWHTDSDADTLILTDAETTLLQSMPYWTYGPSYARHPLIVVKMEDNENG